MTAGVIFAFIEMLMSIGIASLPAELNVVEYGSAFFMRPSQPLRGNRSVQEWPLVALSGARYVKASYGSTFFHQVPFTASLLRQMAARRGIAVSSRAIDGLGDVTAHFITDSITSDHRELQVLFHGSLLNELGDATVPSTESRHICVLLYCRHSNREELGNSCTMSDGDICIASLSLPSRWWETSTEPRSVSAFFGAFRIAGNAECDISYYPPLRQLPSEDSVTFIREVVLADGVAKYQTLREDQHVLLRIPLGTFHPGSKFSVTVQLQSGSKLAAFSVRVKCRVGVRVTAVENRNGTRWRVSADLNTKRQTAMVTAYNLAHNSSSATANDVQDVFDWVFEVIDADAVRDDTGRLAFTIEYELASAGQSRGHVENKVAAKVQIQPDTTFAIVPVVKTSEIVNTAVLTGVVQSYAMTVYSVSYAGHVADVTSQATCHAGDEEILKVSDSCGYVFVDGTETRGSSSATVIVKHTRHARFLQFRVWTPELPLDVEVTDARLGRVVGWQVPDRPYTNSSLLSSTSYPPSNVSRGSISTRTTPSDMITTVEPVDIGPTCRTLYQSTSVDIFARFMISDGVRGSSPYMLHRKAMFCLTDLLRNHIRLSNQTVARLRGGTVVDGLKPGRTEIQVVSKSGQLLGTGELSVVDDTVIIDRLEVEIVSGIELSVEAKSDFPGAIAAQVAKTSRLHSRLQKAIADVSVAFDDGTLFPLSALPTSNYLLNVDTLNASIIKPLPAQQSHLSAPLLIVMAPGRGDLIRVTLSPSSMCAPLSKPSATKVAVTHVEIDIVDDNTQSDARIGGAGNILRNVAETWSGKERKSNGGGSSHDRGGHKKDSNPSHDAQLLSGVTIELGQNRSLELAMYALLAIFGLALAVFSVNCLVFLVRRRRRGRAKDSGSSTADVDWIWIGHDALKRNAIGVECTRTLMPEVDFSEGRSLALSGHVACVADASPPPPPLPPKLGHGSSATLGMVHSRSRGRNTCGVGDHVNGEIIELSHDRRLAQDPTVASWHGRSSRSDTMSDMEWDCARFGITSNQELIAYFDGLRESAA